MAIPTSLNGQITDAVTQSGVTVIGSAPALSLSFLYQATAQALANAAHNATASQQLTQILAQAVAARCVASLRVADADVPHKEKVDVPPIGM